MEKKCSRCKEIKLSSLFVQDKSSFDGLARICKECKNNFYLNNKEKIIKQRKEYRKENRDEISERQKQINKTKHGKIMLTLSHIKQRCGNKNNVRYHRYGGRGIKALLTYDDISFLFDRDNAVNMKQPSIDRINNDGDYVLHNCQFIEWSHNASKDVYKRSINQIDNNGNIVKTWISIAEASRNGFHSQNIVKCCKGLRNHHKGFKWSYQPIGGN